MTKYYRVRLGNEMAYADQALREGFVGVDFGIKLDLANKLPDNWRDFNKEFIPYLIGLDSQKTKVGAGLNAGMAWTLCKGIDVGDLVLSPTVDGTFIVGRVEGQYTYSPLGPLPHRRPIQWFDRRISRDEITFELWKSMRGPGTVVEITSYANEIEKLITGSSATPIFTQDPTIEDASAFALEKHLEDFLIENWNQTILANNFDIYELDGQKVGQQYPTDTGPIDILAIKKDKTELLVVELKKGRASDVVVGQVLRYMGSVKEILAEEGQKVRGIIIALDDDLKIRRALSVTPDIDFYRYEVSFKLIKQ